MAQQLTETVNTVGQLIEALKGIDPATVVATMAPPFTGVRLIQQQDGKVIIFPPITGIKGEDAAA